MAPKKDIPQGLRDYHASGYDGTAASVYAGRRPPRPDQLDEAFARATLPPVEFVTEEGDIPLSLREARYVGARIVGLDRNTSARYSEGNMAIADRTASELAMNTERTAAGAIMHIKQHIARISTELLMDGIAVKDMANLAVATFAEIASNASGKEKSSDRLAAANGLARIAGLYTPKAEDAGAQEGDGEDAMRHEIIKKLNRLLGGRKTVAVEAGSVGAEITDDDGGAAAGV